MAANAAAPSRSVVLCIDDEPVALMVRMQVLQTAGFRVLGAADFASAMKIFESEPVDLVVTDHLLRQESGTQLAAQMKALKPSVPVVVLSGLPDPPEGIEVADLFLTKGESPQHLISKLSELLRH